MEFKISDYLHFNISYINGKYDDIIGKENDILDENAEKVGSKRLRIILNVLFETRIILR